jgi:hypothetical protein
MASDSWIAASMRQSDAEIDTIAARPLRQRSTVSVALLQAQGATLWRRAAGTTRYQRPTIAFADCCFACRGHGAVQVGRFAHRRGGTSLSKRTAVSTATAARSGEATLGLSARSHAIGRPRRLLNGREDPAVSRSP